MSYFGSNYFEADYFGNNFWGEQASAEVGGHYAPQIILTESQLKKLRKKVVKTLPKQLVDELGAKASEKVVQKIAKAEAKKKEVLDKLPTPKELDIALEGKKIKEALEVLRGIEGEIADARRYQAEQQLIQSALDFQELVLESTEKAEALAVEIQRIKQELMNLDDEELFIMLMQ